MGSGCYFLRCLLLQDGQAQVLTAVKKKAKNIGIFLKVSGVNFFPGGHRVSDVERESECE